MYCRRKESFFTSSKRQLDGESVIQSAYKQEQQVMTRQIREGESVRDKLIKLVPAEIIAALREAVDVFTGDTAANDDRTGIVIKKSL